jgi:hypothetical protein
LFPFSPFHFTLEKFDRSSILTMRHWQAIVVCLISLQTLHDISLPCLAAKYNGMMLRIVDGVSIISPRTSSTSHNVSLYSSLPKQFQAFFSDMVFYSDRCCPYSTDLRRHASDSAKAPCTRMFMGQFQE